MAIQQDNKWCGKCNKYVPTNTYESHTRSCEGDSRWKSYSKTRDSAYKLTKRPHER